MWKNLSAQSWRGGITALTLSTLTLSMLTLSTLTSCVSDVWNPEPMPVAPETLALGAGLFTLGSTGEELLYVEPGPQGEQPYAELAEASVEAVALGGVAQRLVPHPDGVRLLALTHARTEDFLVILDTSKTCALDLPVETGCIRRIPTRALHDVLEISPSGRYVLSYISAEAASEGAQGVVNLNEVLIYDLETGESRAAAVGYGPQQVRFAELSTPPRAVLLTRTGMAVVELDTGTTRIRELCISSSTPVYPDGLVLTGDEQYALVTLEGRRNLYTLDLTQSSLPLNILALTTAPKVMVRSASGDHTALLADNGLGVDVITHADFSLTHYTLSRAVNSLDALPGREQLLLTYPNRSEKLSYVLDLSQQKLIGYTHESGYSAVDISPEGGTLVFRYPVGSGGNGPLAYENALGILRLDRGDKQPTPLLLGGNPDAVLFLAGDGPEPMVATLFSAEEAGYVATISTESFAAQTTEVLGGPSRLLQLPADGRLVAEYGRPLGLLSVMPADDLSPVQFLSGYRTAGLN